MIISHSRRFIFIKTKKTASSSMEVALGKYCSEEDVITPLPEEEENYRKQHYAYGARNYHPPLTKWKVRDFLRLLKGKRVGFYNHMAAKRCQEYLPDYVWKGYYKFCFERNPFEKVISYIYFRHAQELDADGGSNVNAFVTDRLLKTVKRGGYGLYTSNGKVIVDRIYRYEDLEDALKDLAERLGLPEIPVLPRMKSSFRKNRRPWHEVLELQNIKRIRDCFSWELEQFYPEILEYLEKIEEVA